MAGTKNSAISGVKTSRRTARFNLGGEQAEADPLLHEGFFESTTYHSVSDPDDSQCFIIGRTGAGKTALLQRLEEDHPSHVIRINPEDLSLPYITDLNVMQHLTDLEVHLDPLFIALWKHVLLIEVIKHRYRIDSPAAKQNFLQQLRTRIARDKSKIAALDYLEEFEGRFWCETDERVRDITTSFETKIQSELGGKIGAPGINSSGSASGVDSRFTETKSQQAERFQRIVNQTQLPRLNHMMNVLNEDILDSSQHFTYVVIDDLDRDWVDEQMANALIRCLFRAVVDLKRVRNLKVIVALRTNIFESLDFGARTGGQEEKFRSLTQRLRWTRADLEELLSERARASAIKYDVEGIRSIKDVLPATNKTRGSALDYILERTLMRPRDAISYFNECLRLARKPKLSWEVIHSAERDYSSNRLLALRDEWKPTFPGLDRVFEQFKGVPVAMNQNEIVGRLEDVALLPSDPSFLGTRWVTELTDGVWSAGVDDDWIDMYYPVLKLLYEIGFLGLSRLGEKRVIFANDDPSLAEVQRRFTEADRFLIHPSFHGALDITVV